MKTEIFADMKATDIFTVIFSFSYNNSIIIPYKQDKFSRLPHTSDRQKQQDITNFQDNYDRKMLLFSFYFSVFSSNTLKFRSFDLFLTKKSPRLNFQNLCFFLQKRTKPLKLLL